MKGHLPVTDILDHADSCCRKNQVRLTAIRRNVLSLMLSEDKALSAYEIISIFKEKFHKTLTPMTAYRTLEFLEEYQLVHRLKTANKYVACAHIGSECSHDLPHFYICQQCLKVDEINTASHLKLEALNVEAKQKGYQLESPQIELSGICNKCATVLT
ncbi:Fur family transcriptional regulator [Thalassotalea eurytherma]|uniref:Fur family transcriptional regulator n=1 Tax=Thalassotalea eurytherma TaxID=1144278 RepID=A0ABQ6H4F8_9GAMM|nr:Fur family transcriptional regulator [Thalassotalea eurytherma]GLX82404.1 Fur family transcriptional regulator [Thalassotalea eurytherma]